MPSESQPTPQRIMEMTWGFAPPLILEAAVRHRIFDFLDARPKTLEELAGETKTSIRGLRALLNVLVGLHFLARQGDRYALVPESAAFLVSTKPAYQGGLLNHVSKHLIGNWMQLPEIVRTGEPVKRVNEEDTGAAFFVDLVEDIFSMSARSAQMLADALAARFAQPTRVLDIAAGSGVWGIMLAKKSPNVTVTAVDWPAVTPVTRRVAQKHGVGDRFSYVNGDLHDADFGTGHHVATLGHILHSEGPKRSEQLIKKVYAALAPGGTMAIAEFVPDDDRSGPPMPLIFAVNMLVNTAEGDTFTFAEMSRWLTAAGFKNIRKLDSAGPSPLILADRP